MLANNENSMYKIIVNGIALTPIKLTVRITEAIKRYLTLFELKS